MKMFKKKNEIQDRQAKKVTQLRKVGAAKCMLSVQGKEEGINNLIITYHAHTN